MEKACLKEFTQKSFSKDLFPFLLNLPYPKQYCFCVLKNNRVFFFLENHLNALQTAIYAYNKLNNLF